MKKTVIILCVLMISKTQAQMVVNDPINGAMQKVLDMLNPKLTQQIQQVKRAKEQLREQVAITTATETQANADMAEIDYQSNVSKFSSNFAIQGLKMKEKEENNIKLYNYGVSLISQIPAQNKNHITFYSKLYTEIKTSMATYEKQSNLLGYKSGGSTTTIDNLFSGSQGGLVNTGNSSAEEQAFVDAKNKADEIANKYKDDINAVNKTYTSLLDAVENPPSGGWLGSVFKGLFNIGTFGLSNQVLDKIQEKGKTGVEEWYSQQTKSLDTDFNTGMTGLGFGDLLSASSGALGSQLGSGKAVKIDPKNGLMDDAGKILLGYNIVEKLDEINSILSANNNALLSLIGKEIFNSSVSQITNGQSKYTTWKTKQDALIVPKQSTTGFY